MPHAGERPADEPISSASPAADPVALVERVAEPEPEPPEANKPDPAHAEAESSVVATVTKEPAPAPEPEPEKPAPPEAQPQTITTTSDAEVSTTKRLRFDAVQVRFYGYTIGQSCPADGGAPLGLSWACNVDEDVVVPLEKFETFRGGLEDDISFASDSPSFSSTSATTTQEFSENWRIPQQFFQAE